MKTSCVSVSIRLLGAVLLAGLLAACFQEAPSSGPVRLAVASDYPPYAYRYQGKLTGIDVELGEQIAREAGRELHIVTGTFSELVGMVATGKADMAACALAVTEDRRRTVAFSDPYEFAGQTFLVRSGENIRYLTDMRKIPGFRIAAETGSTGYTLIATFLKRKHLSMRLIGFADNREAVKALLNRQNDAVILDPLVARCLQMEHPGKLEMLHDLLNHEEFAVAVSRHDPHLLAAANRVIHQLWESGGLAQLQQKHMKQSRNRGGDDVP